LLMPEEFHHSYTKIEQGFYHQHNMKFMQIGLRKAK